MSISTFEWIIFGAILLIIGIIFYFMIRTRRTRKPEKVDDPEDPLTSVFRHLDDL